jgi:hypothetical protein
VRRDARAIDQTRDPPIIEFAKQFAAELSTIPWFTSVGRPLSDGLLESCARYLAAIDRGGLAVRRVESWQDAAVIAGDPSWDRSWWDREEDDRRDLLAQIEGAKGGTVVEALIPIVDAAGNAAEEAASTALAHSHDADPYLARVAAGAATQAAYQAGLALIAEAGRDHPFALKFAIFAAGRWPLGILAGCHYIF